VTQLLLHGAVRQGMTDRHYDADHDAPAAARGASLRGLVNGLGATLSITLVVGMGYWSYGLAVRDVSGVPVVRALEGPMRVAPEAPGGMQAAYQGLSVNTVAAEGTAAPLPERIILAPPPVPLDAADGPLPGSLPADPAEGWRTDLTDASVLMDSQEPPATQARLDADASTGLRLVSADVPGVARSPVPPQRPGTDLVAEAAAQATIAALSPVRSVDVEPEALTPGTRLVQLGAYDTKDAARDDWDRLASRFPALLEGKGRVIQEAESGGSAFYRLRAHGFEDEGDARRFCAVLLAESGTCIPVLIR